MPELPDVAYLQSYLEATSLNQPIEAVEVNAPRLLRGITAEELREALLGRKLARTHRHGKYLLAQLGPGGGWLALHFGMTGWLHYAAAGEAAPPNIRLLLRLAGGRLLAYTSRRMLGGVWLVGSPEELVRERNLGPDALAIGANDFRRLLAAHARLLKPLLMDQHLLAGIGNVYADEILFQAAVHPLRLASALSEEEAERLFSSLRHVLAEAASRQADPQRFPAGWLTPRRRAGRPCPRCGGRITRLEIGGRGAYLCPACQRR